MSRKLATFALAVTAGVAAAGTALSAPATLRLANIKGTVTVNGAPAVAGPVKAGDVVATARSSSSAIIVYADGCRISVKPGSRLTIGAVSPCVAPVAGIGAAGAAAVAGGVASGTLLAGGIVVLGTALVAIAEVTDSDPASP